MTGPRLPDTRTLISWTQDFIRAPSQQTDKFEQEPQVQTFLAGPVVQRLEACGLAWRRDGMGNVIVELGHQNSDRSLMLMTYAMTHPANRMQTPFAGELIDGETRIRGRGVSEQKGALAAAIAAVAAAKDLPLKGRLVLCVSSAGETGRHDAALSIVEALGFLPKQTIIAVGTTGRLALANKGRIDVEVTVKGRVSHSSTPWAGVNAITGAQQVLERVLSLDVSKAEHAGLGKSTLTATSIRSWPEATHTVQDEVKIVFDRRLLPGEDRDAAFRAIAEAANIGAPWVVETTLGPSMYPAEIDPQGPLATAVRKGCEAEGVPPPATFYSSGALDAGLFHVRGAEAAMWGPGDQALWHTENESIGVDELVAGAKGYLGVARAVVG